MTALGATLAVGQGAPTAFQASLTGDQEVPAVDTDALGEVTFRIGKRPGASPAEDVLDHTLVVARITNVVAAHIHCAPEDVNGPVGVTLFLGAPVARSGTLSQGIILAPDAANGCGWADVSDIIDAMISGDTYVNVHTLQNLGGEIRGQIVRIFCYVFSCL